jgi:DNA polymerase-3 subunit chi
MVEIRFYHTQRRSAEEVLPDLLSKALQKNMRVVCKLADDDRCRYYDDYLWRYQPQSFLPHGLESDDFSANQPIVLTTEDRASNQAKTLMVIEDAAVPDDLPYDLVCLVFDGQDQRQVQQARAQWSKFKSEDNVTLSYWQQQDNGQWISKA